MDLKQLHYFVCIVDAGSFTRAADRLAVAQPALSRQVRDLEEELGVLLLHRNGRGVVPTDAGRQLSERARRVLADVEQIKLDMRSTATDVAGTVVVSAPASVSRALGLDLIAAVRAAHPEVEVHLVDGLSAFVLEWLCNGRSDLAVLYEEQARSMAGIEPLIEEHIRLIVPAAWDFAAAGSPVRLRDVMELPFAFVGKTHTLRQLVDEAAQREGLQLPCAWQVDSFGAIRDLLVAGKAATFQPGSAFRHELGEGTLRAHPVIDPPIVRRLVLATSAVRPASPATHAVAEILHRELDRIVREADAVATPPRAMPCMHNR
ncbi:MAG: LysR substrate-binding domain-containing protein [Pseudomonadota bacterium]